MSLLRYNYCNGELIRQQLRLALRWGNCSRADRSMARMFRTLASNMGRLLITAAMLCRMSTAAGETSRGDVSGRGWGRRDREKLWNPYLDDRLQVQGGEK